jgi:hypothetical protein
MVSLREGSACHNCTVLYECRDRRQPLASAKPCCDLQEFADLVGSKRAELTRA